MSKLTTKHRKKMPQSDFALPHHRYPIEDMAHARNALARVSQNGTPAEKKAVARKVANRYPSLAEHSAFIKKELGRRSN